MGLGIHLNFQDVCVDCWCDGCGDRVQVDGLDWHAGRAAINRLGWYTRATDYGDPRGPAWEHFCCKECLDDD